MIRSLGLNETDRLVRDSVMSSIADVPDAGLVSSNRSADAFRALAEIGVLAAPLPEELGGMGEGLGAAALVLEPLGQRALVTPHVESICVPAAIAEFYPSVPSLRGALVSAAQAEPGAVLAWMEPGCGWTRQPSLTMVERSGAEWILRGRKTLVRWGDVVGGFIVTALADAEPTLFWVPRDCEGLEMSVYHSADERSLVDLEFHDLHLPPESRISDGDASVVIDYALDAGAALSLAEAVGLMDRALEMTIDYLKTREQFGVSLSKMQALQHRLVEMYATTECAWSLVHEAVCSLSREVPEIQRQSTVSRAKAYVGRMGRLVGQEALQLHGAIGMTKEYPLGRYLQRLTAIELDYGDSEWHLNRLAGNCR
ncbi:acyl-CoA dehydrogenase [Sinorhizobium sp. BJ1]|uniref:acyl-CoA dehydrogenase n=1 Tax=Sinorhizobium sp. BJ1 TaxID=2035455 RepID=UPI000BE960A5|nr:acyl-CoA dehydrogenase [Sinorhizobium sp. BJ1]PDT78671.1 hypothetical protein CO676_32215 [Sinorhizobium sp. BJ1]